LIKTIIFDFDGTIVDSVNIKTEGFAELYNEYGNNTVKQVVKYHLLNGGVSRYDKIRYFQENILNRKVLEKEIKVLADKFSKLVIDKIVQCPYTKGSSEFISKNYHNYNFFVSTATPNNEIREIIKRRNLDKYFIDIYGSPESKVDHVRKIIAKNNYLIQEVLYIGDSESDKIAAESNGVNFIEFNSNYEESSLMKNDINILNDFSLLDDIINTFN